MKKSLIEQSKMDRVLQKHMVKLVCKNTTGEECGVFNGFFYNDFEPYIVSTANIIGFEGANQYVAILFDNNCFSEKNEVVLEVVKINSAIGVVVFRSNKNIPHLPCSQSVVVGTSHSVFMVGFKIHSCCSDGQLIFNEGRVTHVNVDGTFVINVNIDGVFSGAPIFNTNGYFVGMVKSGDALQTVCISAISIQNVLHHL